MKNQGLGLGMVVVLCLSSLSALGGFFPAGEKEAVFVMKDPKGEVPRDTFLDQGTVQNSIANYVKDAMRKRETTADRKALVNRNDGLQVVVAGAVFTHGADDKVELRLVGDLRERVLENKINLADLEAGREVTVTMGPTAKVIDLGFYITAGVEARTDIRLSWDPKADVLAVPHAYGSIKVSLGGETSDKFEFKDLTGTRGKIARQPVETEF